MEQPAPPKPVMDVMPPKPTANVAVPPTNSAAGPAAHGNPSSVLANAAATGSNPSASPATVESQAEPLTVHAAPPADTDQPSAEEPAAHKPGKHEPTKTPTPKSHASAPKSHGPALAITGVIFGMIALSALAILVYLNS